MDELRARRPPPGRLLLRVDGSVAGGTGHVMRALALAQAWRAAGGAARFATGPLPAALAARVEGAGFPREALPAGSGDAEDAAATARLARAQRTDWVALDGYHFGAPMQRGLVAAGLRVLLFDDYGHAGRYDAHLVVNTALSDPALYADRDPRTELLLGPGYAPLRDEFWRWRGVERPLADPPARLLVTLGGSDPEGKTLEVLRATSGLGLAVTVVVGGSSPHADAVAAAAAELQPPARAVRNPADMASLMAEADLALSGAGTTSFELAFLGVPAVLLVVADNQRRVAESLTAAGAALALHETASCREAIAALAASADRRAEMSARGRKLVDGAGGDRIVARMASRAVA